MVAADGLRAQTCRKSLSESFATTDASDHRGLICLWRGSMLLQRFSVGLAVEYSSCFISVLNLDLSI